MREPNLALPPVSYQDRISIFYTPNYITCYMLRANEAKSILTTRPPMSSVGPSRRAGGGPAGPTTAGCHQIAFTGLGQPPRILRPSATREMASTGS